MGDDMEQHEEHREPRPLQGRDYHDAMLEASVRRIETTLRELVDCNASIVPRVDQLERSVFGYSVGTNVHVGLEQQWLEALPNLRKVNVLIRAVNVLIVGLIPTIGTLLLYLLGQWGVIHP